MHLIIINYKIGSKAINYRIFAFLNLENLYRNGNELIDLKDLNCFSFVIDHRLALKKFPSHDLLLNFIFLFTRKSKSIRLNICLLSLKKSITDQHKHETSRERERDEDQTHVYDARRIGMMMLTGNLNKETNGKKKETGMRRKTQASHKHNTLSVITKESANTHIRTFISASPHVYLSHLF